MDKAKTSQVLKLTKPLIERAKPIIMPDGSVRQRLLFDTELKGFGVSINRDSKTFIAQYPVKGKTVRVTIGRTPPYSLTKAKSEAVKLLLEMRSGINPNEAKRAAREQERGDTLEDAFKDYLKYLATKERSEKTITWYKFIFEKYLGDWKTKTLASITRADCHRKHKNIAEGVVKGKYKGERSRGAGDGRYAANAAMKLFRSIWSRAEILNENLPGNPTIAVDWFKEKRREGVLKLEQLPEWHAQVLTIENPIRRDAVLFTLYTALRDQNTCDVKWADVDFDASVLHIPKPKSQKPFDLPLSRQVLAILKRREKENGEFYPDSPYVFPANSRSGRINSVRVPLPVKWYPHALRNVFATVAKRSGVPEFIYKTLLNHSLGSDVTSGYLMHDVEALRVPMQTISDALDDLCQSKKRKGTNVVNFGGRKRKSK